MPREEQIKLHDIYLLKIAKRNIDKQIEELQLKSKILEKRINEL